MKGAESRLRGEARRHEQIALKAAYQTVAMSRADRPNDLLARFEAAIDRGQNRPTIADRLIAMRDAGAPLRITRTERRI